MATKANRADTLAQFIVAGVVALGIMLMISNIPWLLWVLMPTTILGIALLVRTPRTPFRDAQRAVKAARGGPIGSGMNRKAGWNALGSVSVRNDDPYLVLKGELPADGVVIPVPPGRWYVHARAEMVAKGPTHMRDIELRIVRDLRWVTEEWEWTHNWEPVILSHFGSASQAGRISVDGLLRVHAGRRVRLGRTIVLQPGFSDGAYGVNVLRDLGGAVVAIVSRFG
ncbi:MAG: hypothetical protein HY241_16800 [Actinobacteria bacterium]|nr:hypothetical protein [Actinomycetota bacterium]